MKLRYIIFALLLFVSLHDLGSVVVFFFFFMSFYYYYYFASGYHCCVFAIGLYAEVAHYIRFEGNDIMAYTPVEGEDWERICGVVKAEMRAALVCSRSLFVA